MKKSERISEATEDLALYCKMLRGGNTSGCLLVEQKWELDGLPPNLVTSILSRVAEGMTVDAAFTEVGI